MAKSMCAKARVGRWTVTLRGPDGEAPDEVLAAVRERWERREYLTRGRTGETVFLDLIAIGRVVVHADGGVFRVLADGELRSCTSVNGEGYVYALARGGGKTVSACVHRLVHHVHVGPIPSGFEVDHIDGDTMNNRASNLEAVAPRENKRRARERKPPARGESHRFARLTEVLVRAMRRERDEHSTSFRALGEKFGVSHNQARLICSRRCWAHVK